MRIKPSYIILILVTFFVECLYYSPVFLELLIMEIIILMFSLISIAGAERLSEIKIHISQREGLKREKIRVGIEVNEKFFVPIFMIRGKLIMRNHFLKEEETCNVVLTCTKGTGSIFQEMTSRHYGDIDIWMEDIWLYDLFRIWRIKMKRPLADKISVLPVIGECQWNYGDHEIFSMSERVGSKAKGQESADLSDVRMYRQGDRIQRIHWKLSARTQELMVKEYENSFCGIVLFLDMEYDQEYITLMDRYIETAAAMADRLLSQVQEYYISWFDLDSNDIKREKIETREEIYKCFGELFQSVPYRKKVELEELYTCKYGNGESHTHFRLDIFLKLWKNGELIDDTCGQYIREEKSAIK